ncbi:hypothetical protein SAV14893_068980 [Streptomyces avermitilis]|uniref:Uncharacterized protein n=1 Tax=Streptomyces avermitilis TaxID=33903 RepID=A0A4D4M6P5_STRAX|nr:hypothetical protein SAV14893_068980 [Streptomyces avermitilis]
MRDQDEAVGGVGLDEGVDGLGDGGRGADEGLAAAGLDDQVADRPVVGRGALAPFAGGGQRVAVHPDLGTAAGDGVFAEVRVDVGQRAVRVVRGQVAVPDELQVLDRGGAADLLAAYLAGQLPGLGVRVAEDEGRGGQDQQLVVGTAVPGQAALDVRVERLALLEGAVPAEDGVRAGGGELAPVVGVARLEDHRAALRAARDVELPLDLEVLSLVHEGTGPGVPQEGAGLLVGDDLVAAPGVEEFVRGGEELLGPGVPLALREKAAAAEVLAGEGVPGGDDVPGGASVGEVVEAGELAGHLVGLVEGGVDGAGQTEPVGDGGQRGKDREGVGPADDVQVVDLSALFAQPESLGEEQEVELGAFGGPREVREGAELDVAAGLGIAPHGGVVDAGEVGGQMDLLQRLAHGRTFLRLRRWRRRSGWRGG